MAVTSNWEWGSMPTTLDTNITAVSGVSVYLVKKTDSYSRSRISNDVYVTELGDTAATISGFNGGVTATVTAKSSEEYVMFPEATASNWTRVFTIWRTTGHVVNGRESYWSDGRNSPDASKRNVIWLGATGYGPLPYQWLCAESTTALIEANTWNKSTGAHANAIGTGLYLSLAASPMTPARQNFNLEPYPWGGTTGTFSGAATGATVKLRTPLTCVADSRNYEDGGVDWYTQTQTWESKTGWEAIE